jgi:hypothetical protein
MSALSRETRSSLLSLTAGSIRGSSWLELGGMSVLYLLLAGIATYPLIRSIDSAVVGGGDTAQFMWGLWWMKWAVQRGDILPFHTSMLYHPTGVSLAYHPLTPLNGWLAIVPLVGLELNLATTYNLLTLFSSVGTGLATYYLVRALVGSRTAALTASIIFTFAPIRMSRMLFGQMNLCSTQFVALTALFTVLLLRTRRRRFGVLAGGAMAATAWLSPELALGTGILVLIMLALALVGARGDWLAYLRRRGRPLGIFAVTTLILVLPVIWPMVRDHSEFADQSDQAWASEANSADLVGFVLPDSITPSLAKRVSPKLAQFVHDVYSQFYGNSAEKTVFVGYVVILLLAFAIATAWSSEVRRWLVIAAAFFVLCLGPVLHVSGKPVLNHLPFEWLNQIPVIGFGRSPSRNALFLMLALAVAIGYGLATVESRRPRFRFITPLLGLLVFVEFLTIPVRLDTRFSYIPAYYYQLRTQEEATAAILDVPIDLYGAQGPAANYMLYQTVHHKPIVGGYISRTPSTALWPFERPFLNELRARVYDDTTPFHFDQGVLQAGADDLSLLDVGYVILHRDEVSIEDYVTLRAALEAVLSAPTHEDDRLVVWEIEPSP